MVKLDGQQHEPGFGKELAWKSFNPGIPGVVGARSERGAARHVRGVEQDRVGRQQRLWDLPRILKLLDYLVAHASFTLPFGQLPSATCGGPNGSRTDRRGLGFQASRVSGVEGFRRRAGFAANSASVICLLFAVWGFVIYIYTYIYIIYIYIHIYMKIILL